MFTQAKQADAQPKKAFIMFTPNQEANGYLEISLDDFLQFLIHDGNISKYNEKSRLYIIEQCRLCTEDEIRKTNGQPPSIPNTKYCRYIFQLHATDKAARIMLYTKSYNELAKTISFKREDQFNIKKNEWELGTLFMVDASSFHSQNQKSPKKNRSFKV
jgi:hypothetical protein